MAKINNRKLQNNAGIWQVEFDVGMTIYLASLVVEKLKGKSKIVGTNYSYQQTARR